MAHPRPSQNSRGNNMESKPSGFGAFRALRNIRTRLFFTYLLLILFTSTLMGSLFYYLTREHLLRSKEKYLGSSAEVFIKIITPFAEKEVDLAPAARFFIRQCWEQLDYQLQVIDKKGEIICDSRGFTQTAGYADKRFRRALEGKSEVWIEKSPEGQIMCKCVPIQFNNRIVGAARLSISLRELDELFSAMRKYFVLTFGLSLITAIVSSLFFIKTLMRPIIRIRDTAVKIAGGDLDSQVNYDSPDELGDLSRTINFMSLELKKVEQARAAFLGNVSHELKTPLTIIKGFVITLLGTPGISAEWSRPLELIDRETDRLTRLVEEILELTRLRSGHAVLRYSHCDLGEILRVIGAQMAPKAEKSGVTLHVRYEGLPEIWADSDRIKEVLLNLIDNALKYGVSENGKIEVEASASGEIVEIEVRDNGPGIPADELPFVFERFFRGGSKKVVDGTGLGLAIVREIVTAHKGSISIRSNTGEGTCFTVKIPFKSPGEATPPQ